MRPPKAAQIGSNLEPRERANRRLAIIRAAAAAAAATLTCSQARLARLAHLAKRLARICRAPLDGRVSRRPELCAHAQQRDNPSSASLFDAMMIDLWLATCVVCNKNALCLSLSMSSALAVQQLTATASSSSSSSSCCNWELRLASQQAALIQLSQAE